MNSPLSKAERALMAKIGARGGNARKRNLTKAELTRIGKLGAKARHAKRNGDGR